MWSLFPSDTDYFGPGNRQFMVNYRVSDLDALLAALREEGVDLVDGIEEYAYGRFAWIEDPEGNRIEMWEPPTGEADAEPSVEAKRDEKDGISLRRSVLVAASPDRAFRIFTERLGTWQISPSRVPEPDPSRASEVQVTFMEEERGTMVVVEHRGFHRHGEGAEGYRRAMDSDRGWPLILDRLAAAFQG